MNPQTAVDLSRKPLIVATMIAMLLFLLVDGWRLAVEMLLQSFQMFN